MSARDRDYEMSERDKAMADLIATSTADKIIDALTDKERAGHVIDTWSGHLQQIVGRAVLRLALYLLLMALAIASFKFGLVDRVTEVFRK